MCAVHARARSSRCSTERSWRCTARDLVIADGAGAVGLSGWAKRSAVSEATREIFLEIAYFAPPLISASARRHGLITMPRNGSSAASTRAHRKGP